MFTDDMDEAARAGFLKRLRAELRTFSMLRYHALMVNKSVELSEVYGKTVNRLMAEIDDLMQK